MYNPAPERIVELYEKLDRGDSLDLVWKNPGRRPPTPVKVEAAPAKTEVDDSTADANDFDFEEESQGVVTPQRRAPGSELKGSARKQTASFNTVLSNMKRHKMLDQGEDNTKQ